MSPTQHLRDPGQRLWQDKIMRGLLASGTPRQYVDDLSITKFAHGAACSQRRLQGRSKHYSPGMAELRDGIQGVTGGVKSRNIVR